MRLGFRYYTAPADKQPTPTTLWTTMRPGGSPPASWGRISKATVSYSDMQITECKVTFNQPSERLTRSLLAICVPEATPMDLGLDLLCGSLWVQDIRFGYDPQPLFYGNILAVEESFANGGSNLSVTLHDLKRLINMQRDLQDYQNLTDDSIMQMLSMRLNEVLTQDGVSLGQMVLDQAKLAAVRQNSTGAVRQYNARNMGRLLNATQLDKLRVACRALGFTIKAQITRNPQTPDEAYQKFTLMPIGGELERPAGTYSYGDGEVISFAPRFTPPSSVLQRNVMSKHFDPVNEILQLENAKLCVELDKDNIIRNKDKSALPRDAITTSVLLMDAQGNPVDLKTYQNTTRPFFAEGLQVLGPDTTGDLWRYHDRIGLRKGLIAPGQTPAAVQQSGPGGAKDITGFNETSQETGELFWRFTGRLQTRFNPLLTTTDYLRLKGFGVWDGAWGIKSFTHDLGESSTTSFDLTFGNPAKTS